MTALEKVHKKLTILVIIKAFGSGLVQYGTWQAGYNPAITMVIFPALTYFLGTLLIRTFVTEERLASFTRLMPLIVVFVTLAVVHNIVSFLINMGHIQTW